MDQKEIEQRIKEGRAFMHPSIEDPSYQTDQELKKPQPPLVKEPMCQTQIALPTNFEDLNIDNDFLHIINTRESHRVYTQENISLLELSYLLWCTQGVKGTRGKKYATLRTVPCGGARHEFETYLAIQYVDGLKSGFYHYLPMRHEIECIEEAEDLPSFIGPSLQGQVWANKASVVFYYSVVPYRAEWRYGIYTHSVAMVDAGHITQNLYLASTSIGLGGCAIGAVTEAICNEKFHLDGEEEFIFYAHTIGTISENDKQKELDFYAFIHDYE
ncbi:MAG: SagB/ThcOx family dehydrogenase [Solobacterium sp.]|nr:SagB/ThcOx family dehydrogenase [Solobacterium sp.]